MNFDALSTVKFGDRDSLGEFLFENGLQHKLFQETFMDNNIPVPVFPIMDADIDNLDDWLLAHQVEHQAFADQLGLENPFNMLDTDWNVEEDFYDWLNQHYNVHQQIAVSLGLT
jgi:hypothetical protein